MIRENYTDTIGIQGIHIDHPIQVIHQVQALSDLFLKCHLCVSIHTNTYYPYMHPHAPSHQLFQHLTCLHSETCFCGSRGSSSWHSHSFFTIRRLSRHCILTKRIGVSNHKYHKFENGWILSHLSVLESTKPLRLDLWTCIGRLRATLKVATVPWWSSNDLYSLRFGRLHSCSGCHSMHGFSGLGC